MSCASISGTSQIIAIDSKNRGTDVYLSPNATKPIGITPFFFETDKKKQHHFYVRDKKKQLQKQTFTCSIDWISTFGLNGLLSAFFGASSVGTGVLTFGIFLGIDFGTGAAYSCDHELNLKDFNSKPNYCRRYLVAPVYHNDADISMKVAQDWIKHAKKQLYLCHNFVDLDESRQLFHYLNIDNKENIEIKSINRQGLLKIASETDATDLVILKYKKNKRRLAVKPQVYDLATSKLVPNTTLGKNLQTNLSIPNLPEGLENIQIRSLLAFLPNSITFGLSEIEYQPDTLGLYETKGQQINKLPTIISGWGLNNTDHPQAFGTWDYSFKIYPSLSLGNYQTQHAPLEESSTLEKQDFDLMYGTMVGNLRITAHTPLGAISLGLGSGGMALRGHFNTRTHSSIELILHGFYNYTAFLNPDVFFYVNASNFQPLTKERFIKDTEFGIQSFTTVSFGLGYFIPAARHWLKKWL